MTHQETATRDAQLAILLDKAQKGRLSRREVVRRAAAIGVSAGAVGAALRKAPIVRGQGTPVQFWTGFTDPDLSVLRSMTDTFNAQSGGTQVELRQIPPAEVTDVTSLMTAVRGGTGPDVYLLDRFITAQRAADGLLQDLTPLLAQPLAETHLPFAVSESSFDGKPYTIPFNTDARALYYNITLMEAAGVDPAPLDPANGPVTWDALAAIANQLNVADANGNYTTMGFIPWLNQGWHYTYGFSYGGEFFDEAACEVTPDNERVVAAFQWVQDYCEALGYQQVQAFGSPSMQPGFAAQEHPFITGNLAIQITGDWYINQLRTYAPDMEYGITFIPVPAEGDTSATWAGGWSLAVPEGAKNVEGAGEFLNWFAGEPGQRIYTKESAHLPTVSALLEDASLYEERHRFFSEELLPIAKNRPPLPVGAQYWDELTAAWQATYIGEAEPAEALATVKERVNAQLGAFCPIELGS
ncbi:MAG: ABC transporter substrate-binding protein [Chloroflexia bacterium]|nr:ABC transporter substrate-binding protein [Chloroflexia bacterium]